MKRVSGGKFEGGGRSADIGARCGKFEKGAGGKEY